MTTIDHGLITGGCDLCGDFPAILTPLCHPFAPLRVEMISANEFVLLCYVPECRREVARIRGQVIPRGTSKQ